MKTVMMNMALALAFLTAASAMAGDGKEVDSLIKCHEGKFDAMNAVSQLTAEISGAKGAVFGWSGIGAYPDGHMDGELVFVRAPFTVSAPTFVQVGDTPWACVTIQRR
jgi:hypothetical protein